MNLSADQERRINNQINRGIVTQVDYEQGLCRVQLDSLETDWLPFSSVRLGRVKVWNPPCPGEQVMLISENGELDTALVTASFAFDRNKMPSNNPNSIELHCEDDAVFVYDYETHRLSVHLPDDSKTTLISNKLHVVADDILVECENYTVKSENYNISSDQYSLNCDSYNLSSKNNLQNGALFINGIPYLSHNHKGVTSGRGVTGGVSV